MSRAPIVTVSGRQTLRLQEGTNTGEDTGYRISTFDSDGDNVTPSVDDPRFEIVSGALRVKAGGFFNHRIEDVVRLQIRGADDSGDSLSHTVNLRINVSDIPRSCSLKKATIPEMTRFQRRSWPATVWCSILPSMRYGIGSRTATPFFSAMTAVRTRSSRPSH